MTGNTEVDAKTANRPSSRIKCRCFQEDADQRVPEVVTFDQIFISAQAVAFDACRSLVLTSRMVEPIDL